MAAESPLSWLQSSQHSETSGKDQTQRPGELIEKNQVPNLLAWVGILGGLSAIFSPFLGLAALPLALWAIHLRAHPWTSHDQTAPRASDEAERVFLAFVLLLVAFYAMGNKGVGSDRLTIPEQHKKDVTCMLLSVLGLCAFLVRDILRRKSIITGCFTIACAFLLLELFVMWVWN